MPSITYAMECPKGNESFTIHMANIGDTWVLVEFECWQETISFHLGPHSNTSIEAIFHQRINPRQKYPSDACLFEAMPYFQEVRVYAWESDYDLKDDILLCDFSLGSEIPAVNHTTDCTPNDHGLFTVQLVNSGDVWVSVELHCLNGMMMFNLEPRSTLSVSAVFNEWLNQDQVYPENSCAFEDWKQYQDLVIYSEEPDFDSRTDTLTCPYSVGKTSPAVEHFTDCVIGDVDLFKISLQNVGDVWVYVQLECSNGYQEYFLEPQSNRTVLGALNTAEAVVEEVCVFTDGSPPHLRIYNEESDWDSFSFEIHCRPDELSVSDWEADYSWRRLTKRDTHSL
ncbi:uncharacterized protein LOC135471019 [Liolophura sinensis]|uniref:uncharacterized protein LOC135471019 n=1 Tax=Liolophura sinensis TaxID=3198878 RepID=UPI0031597F29